MNIGDWIIENDGQGWVCKLPSKSKKKTKKITYTYKYYPRMEQAILACADRSLPDTSWADVLDELQLLREDVEDTLSELREACREPQADDLPRSEVLLRRFRERSHSQTRKN